MVAITIERLLKRFGEAIALNRVSLRIDPGELFFLLGPSGCGKTTLLRSIAGFYLPEEGSIYFGDENVTAVPPHQRNTGMMFQSYALWPHMTVAGNVAFGLEERKIAKAEIQRRVRDALDSVHMGAYAERKIAQLSGGQQQRVALARALVIRPRCLLLDEPLSNLDAKLRLEMRCEIRRVCKEFGLTAIYVTHDQKEALSISDRMAILDGGHIVQTGTPAEVYRRPRTKAVADFIGETNFIPGEFLAQENGRWLAATAMGEFWGYPGEENWMPTPGEAVALSVRPECWKLVEAATANNAAKGCVGESIYLGELAQYRFDANGLELKIFELNPRIASRGTGQACYAVAAAEDVVFLRP